MRPLILLLCLLIGLPLLLAAGALLLNHPPLWAPPGPWVRLQRYLTTNLADTCGADRLPELHPLLLPGTPEAVRGRVLRAMRGLGWAVEARGGVLHGVVRTPLLGFRDDVEVRLEPEAAGVRLCLRSRSRLGRADFAANERHLLDLMRALQEPT